MPLVIGDRACTSGLSKRLYDNWTTDSGNVPNKSGLSDPLEGAAQECVKALCYAVAKAVVDEINENL
jgi:hypothetical protein